MIKGVVVYNVLVVSGKTEFSRVVNTFLFYHVQYFFYNIVTILEFLAIRKIQLTSHCMRPKNEVVRDLVQFKFTY